MTRWNEGATTLQDNEGATPIRDTVHLLDKSIPSVLQELYYKMHLLCSNECDLPAFIVANKLNITIPGSEKIGGHDKHVKKSSTLIDLD